jgi:hypothetical protein
MTERKRLEQLRLIEENLEEEAILQSATEISQ